MIARQNIQRNDKYEQGEYRMLQILACLKNVFPSMLKIYVYINRTKLVTIKFQFGTSVLFLWFGVCKN